MDRDYTEREQKMVRAAVAKLYRFREGDAMETIENTIDEPAQFVRNAWYVAGWATDFGHHLSTRTILGEPVVLFRRRDGSLAALADRCPHRFLPLSMGTLINDTVQCGYHGMTFDGHGTCVRIPEQTLIPPAARVRSYAVTERMGLAWIWMGDAEQADRRQLFDLAQFHDPDWGVGYGDALHVNAGYLALADNLCDPAHVSFVHTTTLGSPAGIGVPVHSETRDQTVLTWRWTPNSEPVGFFQKFGDFTGCVDRWQYYYLHAPSTAIVDFGSAPARPGQVFDVNALDELPNESMRVFSCHFLTPETEHTTIDYWLHVRNFAVTNDATSAAISEQFRIAFAEDKIILEAVQAEEERLPGIAPLRLSIDAGPARLRRVIAQMLAAS